MWSFPLARPTAACSTGWPCPDLLSIKQIGDKVVLTWTNAKFALQPAMNVAGTYTTLKGATSHYANVITGPGMYSRLVH